jgi:CRP-like cAMP-binding protein
MIVDGERVRLLGTNSLFKGVSKSFLKPFLKPKYFSEVKEGEIIYVCGDEASEIFLIVEGEVKIKFSCNDNDNDNENGNGNGNVNVKHKYLSDFFGEDEILNGCERTSSAVANTDCVLFKMNSAELKQLSSSDKKITDNLKGKDVVEDEVNNDMNPADYISPMDSNEEPGSSDLPQENFDDDVDWKLAEG